MEICDYHNDKESNIEIWGYLFFSNDSRFINKILCSNANFLTFRDVKKKKILRGIFNTCTGKTGYCEDIDYKNFPITVKCALYKDNEEVKLLATYEQDRQDSNYFVRNSHEIVKLEIKKNQK